MTGTSGPWWSSSSSSTPAGPSAKIHVMVVDDSYLDRKLMQRLLNTNSFEVTTADCAANALELLGLGGKSPQKLDVDMIITDYCMPDLTGYDLLVKIMQSETHREIPVIIVTSEYVETRRTRCMEEGARDFLIKPLKASDLSRLRNYVNK